MIKIYIKKYQPLLQLNKLQQKYKSTKKNNNHHHHVKKILSKPTWSIKETLIDNNVNTTTTTATTTTTITDTELNRLANLSQIEITEDEKEIYKIRLNKILNFASTIDNNLEIQQHHDNNNNSEHFTTLNHEYNLLLREDQLSLKSNNDDDDNVILQNATTSKWNYFVVDQAINEKLHDDEVEEKEE